MDKQKTGYNFNSVDLLIYIWKKRWILLTVGLLAAVTSIVISVMIVPMFRATVIMFPSSNASISKELLVQSFSGRQSVHGIGLADVSQVLRGLDDVPPGQPPGVEDELNVV